MDYYQVASEHSPVPQQYPSMKPTFQVPVETKPQMVPPMPQPVMRPPMQQPNHKAVQYTHEKFTFDMKEIFKRAFKYLLEGLVVSFAAHYFGKNRLQPNEIIVIGFVAAVVFAILDLAAPAVSTGARTGAGFAIGYNTLGYNPMFAPAAVPM
jgi:hypothetical protein